MPAPGRRPVVVTPHAIRAHAVLRAAAAQTFLVGSSAVAGLLGTHATRFSEVASGDGSEHPFWPGGTPPLRRLAAMEVVGALPLAAPLAIAAALVEPSVVSRRPFLTWACANIAALGVAPAAGAVGRVLVGGGADSEPLALASMVGQIALFAIECSAVVSISMVLAVVSLSATTRQMVPRWMLPMMHRSSAWYGLVADSMGEATATGRQRRTSQSFSPPCPPYDHELERLPEYSSRRPSLHEPRSGAPA